MADIATLMELRSFDAPRGGQQAGEPVSLDEAGAKIDNQIQIGHTAIIGGHCLLVAQTGLAGGGEIIAIARLVRDGTADPEGEGRE